MEWLGVPARSKLATGAARVRVRQLGSEKEAAGLLWDLYRGIARGLARDPEETGIDFESQSNSASGGRREESLTCGPRVSAS
jgi:hypothetical protein